MMGDDHAGDGPPAKRAFQQILPDPPCLAAVEPGIDDGPAIAIAQGIDVDMVKRHRQRRAQPEDTLRNLHGLAGGGRGLERVMDHAERSSAVIA